MSHPVLAQSGLAGDEPSHCPTPSTTPPPFLSSPSRHPHSSSLIHKPQTPRLSPTHSSLFRPRRRGLLSVSYDLQNLSTNPDQYEHSYLQLDFSDFLQSDQTLYDVFSSSDGYSSKADSHNLFVDDKFDFTFDLPSALLPATATGGHDTSSTVPLGPSTELWPAFLNLNNTDVLSPETVPSCNTSSMQSSPALGELTWAPINTVKGPTSATVTSQSSPAMRSTQTSTISALPSPSSSKSPEPTQDSHKRKRERNTEAARRYRQRRQDRLEELEELLAAMTKDRDDYKIKLARSEAEVDVFRRLMTKN